jgi:hypothetical protein
MALLYVQVTHPTLRGGISLTTGGQVVKPGRRELMRMP